MNSTLPGCRTSYPSPRPNDIRMLPWTRENPIGPRLECTTIVLHFPRRDSSHAGAIATCIDRWSDLRRILRQLAVVSKSGAVCQWAPPLANSPFRLTGPREDYGTHPPISYSSRFGIATLHGVVSMHNKQDLDTPFMR